MIIYLPLSGTGWFRETCQWTDHTDPNDGHTEFVWYHYYHIIASANNIINAADGMVETALLNSVLGQAHAYRAFLYHRLVALYGKNPQYSDANTEEGVPLMFETAPPYEGLERSSVAEVYKQCEDDIKAAIAYLAKATTSNNKSYISLAAANGIAARIALSKGDFVNAATYANAARQGFALMSKDEFKSGFNSVDNREWIWGATVVADQTNYFRSWFYYVGMNFNGSFDRGTPRFMNEVLYNQISVTDYRREVILATAPNNVKTWDWTSDDPNDKDPNYATEAEWKAARKEMADTYFGGLSNFKTYPHQCAKFLNENGGTIEPEDVLYMRVAEMYLTEAEALAKQGGKDAAAAQVLYELVSTRDAGYVLSTNTGDALIAEILLQRRIELFGEGHRWFDMLRNNEELDLTGSSADKSFYTKGYKQARPSINHNNWVFQIPQGRN